MSMLRLARACASVPARSTPLLLGRMGLPSARLRPVVGASPLLSRRLLRPRPVVCASPLLPRRLLSTQPNRAQPSKPWGWREAFGYVGRCVGTFFVTIWVLDHVGQDLTHLYWMKYCDDMAAVAGACKELADDPRNEGRVLKALLGGQADGGGEGSGEKEDLLAARDKLKACATAVGEVAEQRIHQYMLPFMTRAGKREGEAGEAKDVRAAKLVLTTLFYKPAGEGEKKGADSGIQEGVEAVAEPAREGGK